MNLNAVIKTPEKMQRIHQIKTKPTMDENLFLFEPQSTRKMKIIVNLKRKQKSATQLFN